MLPTTHAIDSDQLWADTDSQGPKKQDLICPVLALVSNQQIQSRPHDTVMLVESSLAS